MNRIDVDAMTTDQKLKLLQLSLHYVLPKLRSSEIVERQEQDLPLFVDVQVIDRKEETGEWTSEIYPLEKKIS